MSWTAFAVPTMEPSAQAAYSFGCCQGSGAVRRGGVTDPSTWVLQEKGEGGGKEGKKKKKTEARKPVNWYLKARYNSSALQGVGHCSRNKHQTRFTAVPYCPYCPYSAVFSGPALSSVVVALKVSFFMHLSGMSLVDLAHYFLFASVSSYCESCERGSSSSWRCVVASTQVDLVVPERAHCNMAGQRSLVAGCTCLDSTSGCFSTTQNPGICESHELGLRNI